MLIGALLGVLGWAVNVSSAKITSDSVNIYDYTSVPGTDITNLFSHSSTLVACQDTGNSIASAFTAVTFDPCQAGGCQLGTLDQSTLDNLNIANTTKYVGYDWNYLASPNLTNYLVIDGNVLNFDPYISVYPSEIAGDELDGLIRTVLNQSFAEGGRDATKLFRRKSEFQASMNCLIQKYKAGHIDKDTPGCFASQLILFFALGCVLSIVVARFLMALIFAWFISRRLSRTPPPAPRSNALVLPNQTMEMSNMSPAAKSPFSSVAKQDIEVGNDLYTVMLITCYSENTEGIRGTVESLSMTDYPDDRKLLFLIADGIITGHGETMTTPDMCLSLMHFDDPAMKNPEPKAYIAVANGAKMYNRAKVYAGHYCKYIC